MEVILKQDVDHLGLRGEVVNVARGYARNFLLPRGLAEVATPGLVKELAKRDERRARSDAKTIEEARAIAVKRAREMALLPYVAEGRDDRPERGERGRDRDRDR